MCVEIFKYGLKENDKRKEEVTSFWECVEEAKSENKVVGMKTIETFMEEKKKVRRNHLFHTLFVSNDFTDFYSFRFSYGLDTI